MSNRIVILGAGPTGLGAARALDELGHTEYQLFEASRTAGGLAGSKVDPAGFTWDKGGHVVFSHFGEFDHVLEEVMGDEIERHDRSSHILVCDSAQTDYREVPYPFQNHPSDMPPDMAYDVIKGMITRGADDPQGDDFQSWAIRAFGRGAYQHFMGPYNAKVWATPPDQMSSDWMAERVSEPSLEAVLRNLTHGTVEKAWGPNSMFSFPSAGGTGEIWRRVAKTLRNPIIYDARTVRIDTGRRVIYFADGRTTTYDKLISTMPLNQLIEQSDLHKGQNLLETMKLRHNQVMVIGVGFAETRLPDWSWAYYPQPRDEIPFYRVTNFTKYAKANAPMTRHRDRVGTGPAVGYMCEIAFTANEVIPPRDVLFERCIKSLVELDIAEHCNWDTETLSLWAEHLPYAYPVPTPGRVEALAVLQPQLRKRGVLSRGRFGAWRYEYGNQDHSYQQGLEAARNLLLDEPETMITD